MVRGQDTRAPRLPPDPLQKSVSRPTGGVLRAQRRFGPAEAAFQAPGASQTTDPAGVVHTGVPHPVVEVRHDPAEVVATGVETQQVEEDARVQAPRDGHDHRARGREDVALGE